MIIVHCSRIQNIRTVQGLSRRKTLWGERRVSVQNNNNTYNVFMMG